MRWYSVLAIYLLFWIITLFAVLPHGVKTADELGENKIPGQADSAPGNVSMWKKALWTTIVSALLFLPFYLNWQMGWITRADLEALWPDSIMGYER